MNTNNNFTMDNSTETQQYDQPQPPENRNKRKSAAGRSLIRWDFEKDQHLLLCLEYEAAKIGLQLPWDAAVQHIKPGATGQAAIQHLTKVRKYRQEKGQPVPPEPTRRRTTGKKTDGPSKKRKAMDEDDDDEEVVENPFNGSTCRMIFQPINKKAPRRNTAPTIPSGNTPKPAKAPRRRAPSKVKDQDSSEPSRNGADVQVGSEGEWKPTSNVSQPKKKRNRSSRSGIKHELEHLAAPILGSRLRAIDDINYAEPDTLEGLEEPEEANDHDYSAYNDNGAYVLGMGHADEEFDEADDLKPTAPQSQQDYQPLSTTNYLDSTGAIGSHGSDERIVDTDRSANIIGSATMQSPGTEAGHEAYANNTIPYGTFSGNIPGLDHGLGMSWGEGTDFATHSNMPGDSPPGYGFPTPRASINHKRKSSSFIETAPPTDMPAKKRKNIQGSFGTDIGQGTQEFGQLQYPIPEQNYIHHLGGPQSYSFPGNSFVSYTMNDTFPPPQQHPARHLTDPTTPVLPQPHQFMHMAHSASSPSFTTTQGYQSRNKKPQGYQVISPQQLQNDLSRQPNSSPMPNMSQPNQEAQSGPATSPPALSTDLSSMYSASPYDEHSEVYNHMSPHDDGGAAFEMAFGDGTNDIENGSLADFADIFKVEDAVHLF